MRMEVVYACKIYSRLNEEVEGGRQTFLKYFIAMNSTPLDTPMHNYSAAGALSTLPLYTDLSKDDVFFSFYSEIPSPSSESLNIFRLYCIPYWYTQMEMALTRIIYIFKQEKSLAATEEERTYLLFCTNHIVVYSLCCLVSAYTLEDVLWPISDLKKEKKGLGLP